MYAIAPFFRGTLFLASREAARFKTAQRNALGNVTAEA